MSNKLTFVEAEERLKNTNLKFDAQLVEYIDAKNILIKTKYGICKTSWTTLENSEITIKSAINKNEYITNKLLDLYGNNYDYSLINYINCKTPITLICKKHGLFKITSDGLLNDSKGCKKCGYERIGKKLTKNVDTFINESKSIHNNKYNYSQVIYKTCKDLVKIICPIHGEFLQTPDTHINKGGCKKCGNISISKKLSINPNGWSKTIWKNGGEKSKRFDNFKVYILECWNDSERFFKIGRTFLTTKNRFSGKYTMPYKHIVLREIVGSADEIFKLERKLKNENKKYKYFPKLDFYGKYECFSRMD